MDINNKNKNMYISDKINEKDNHIYVVDKNINDDEKKTSVEEKLSKELRSNCEIPKNEENIKNENLKKILVNEEDLNPGIPIGKKIMDTIILHLNTYWLELIGTLFLAISIIIYETIGIIILTLIKLLLSYEVSIKDIVDAFSVLINNIGFKWFIFIIVNQHLSVGFFCLTTFSYMLQEIRNIKKFYFINFIMFGAYYAVSVIITKVIIRDFIGGNIIKKIEEVKIMEKEKSFEIINPLIEDSVGFMSRFLSTFNIFLEKLVLGSIYLFLFYEPNTCIKKRILILRLFSLIPILFIVVSLIVRALENYKIINLNEYISALLLGPKISVYGYFISTLIVLKYKSLEYNIFDSDNYIYSGIFTKIGFKIFGLFGIVELIIGLFFPELINIGIGRNYLFVLSAPISSIYDYKKQNEISLPCCKNKNCSCWFKIIIYVVSFAIVVLLGIILLLLLVGIITSYIIPLIELIIDNIDIFREAIKIFL